MRIGVHFERESVFILGENTQYEPELIKETLPTPACSFHIMHSHFLNRDLNKLVEYANLIKKAATILQPIYISDHIGIFDYNNRPLPFMQEISYSGYFKIFKKKASVWSEMLENIIYYENFPSYEIQPFSQLEFYSLIQCELSKHANILFDLSNAMIAEKNGCESALDWKSIASKTSHFHVGGYEKANNSRYYIDSHNKQISLETKNFMVEMMPILNRPECTLVVERDSNLNNTQWQEDIDTMREMVNEPVTI